MAMSHMISNIILNHTTALTHRVIMFSIRENLCESLDSVYVSLSPNVGRKSQSQAIF